MRKAIKILVVGSSHGLSGDRRARFEEACREIGKALAKSGFEIVVGADGTNTADRHVVEGVAAVEGKHRVLVIRPDDRDCPFLDIKLEHPERIEFNWQRLRGSWSAGRVPQLLAAHAVLLIGGGNGTLVTGQVAPALQKPVLTIGCFGGAAEELWKDFSPFYQHLGPVSERVPKLLNIWQTGDAALVAETLDALIRRNPFRTVPRLPLGVYLAGLIALLALWVWLFIAQPGYPHYAYSFFGLLGVAGLLGTMLRTNLRLMNDPTAIFSWNEMAIELGAGLILAFALGLLYLLGAIAIKDASSATLLPRQPADFQRVAIVMTVLGLGAGLLIEQAAERVQRWYAEQLGDRAPDR